MNRRKFLQLAGVTAAGGILSSCSMNPEKLIPLLVPPDNGTVPGIFDYYASTCIQCPAGCGLIVRTSEGRANKIEGNPLHPVNRGKLCARGQATLQTLYHPDRIRQPLKRSGSRGSGKFSPISWEEGLSLLAQKLEETKRVSTDKKMIFFSPELRGSMLQLVRSFIDYFNGKHIPYESLNTESHKKTSFSIYGRYAMPDYDIGNAQYVISFGADFLETFASPVRYGVAFGKMRRARATVRGLLTYAGPRMSMTAASADSWLPVRTGKEGILALGMANVILKEMLYDTTSLTRSGLNLRELETVIADYSIKRVAEETGLLEHDILSTARDFAKLRPSVAIAGDTVAYQTNGLDSLKVIQLLNLITDNLGKQGGVHFSSENLEQATGSYSELLDSLDSMSQGRVSIALIHGIDPVYTMPKKSGFENALEKVPFIASFSSFLDDTTLQADLILPGHTNLESWGDIIPSHGGSSGVIGIMQPVVRPVHDTRAFPDILLALAKGHDGKIPAILQYKNYPEMLKEHVRRISGQPAIDFELEWRKILQKGGILEEVIKPVSAIKRSDKIALTIPREVAVAGEKNEFPLDLLLFPSPILYDGRSSHLPWLQETPDPMSNAVWGTWVEINPKTAEQLGIKQGDLVEVESSESSVQVPAVIYPGIRPEVVAMPLGQGHRDFGRFAAKRGVNPLDLLDPVIDEENRLQVWGITRVRIKRISKKGGLITSGHPEGSYRGELLEI